jgi:hypothetical protein
MQSLCGKINYLPSHEKEHFEWRGIYLVGKTAIGRTTVRVLNINSEDQLLLRSA